MLTDVLTQILKDAFVKAGYDESYGIVVKSQRPDLSQFQCNGAMSAAKQYKKAPFMISDDVVNVVKSVNNIEDIISKIETIRPGFINISVTDAYLAKHTEALTTDEMIGYKKPEVVKTAVIDYGGPNIAKPLHIGHIRTAIIGESLKRILKFTGQEVIADVHVGDWGLQMGMILSEYKRTHPELPYFDDSFEGEYPKEPPFILAELEEVYPRVSKLTKQDEQIMAEAKEYTYKLQQGDKGCLAFWNHIVDISIKDIKKNYDKLGVSFDYWYGESHGSKYVEPVVSILDKKGVTYKSDGAIVVDVAREDDDVTVPPMLLFKSDGSILYSTTDLATIYQRQEDFQPSNILYVVDNRQATHFKQVFRCAQNNDIIPDSTELEFIGFGTMNGKDGKPFKTRDGGTIRLSDLIDMVIGNAKEKILANAKENAEKELDVDIDEVAHKIGIATLKFADLSNYRTKDYVFDLDKFSSFEGKTGPYLLYSYVRINNIINKLEDVNIAPGKLIQPASDIERNLQLKLDELPLAIENAAKDRAPSYICEYVYDLSSLINGFYHKHHILNEENDEQKKSWMQLLILSRKVIALCLELLGIEAPEKM